MYRIKSQYSVMLYTPVHWYTNHIIANKYTAVWDDIGRFWIGKSGHKSGGFGEFGTYWVKPGRAVSLDFIFTRATFSIWKVDLANHEHANFYTFGCFYYCALLNQIKVIFHTIKNNTSNYPIIFSPTKSVFEAGKRLFMVRARILLSCGLEKHS